MGKRGPAPQPKAHVSQSQKYRRKKEPETMQDRETGSKTPNMPRQLPIYAKHEWAKLVKMLGRRGIITELDQRALERYVRALSRLHDLELIYDRYINGDPEIDELAKLKRELRADTKLVNELCAKFGLSPADRARLVVEPEPAKVPAAKTRPSLSILSPQKQA